MILAYKFDFSTMVPYLGQFLDGAKLTIILSLLTVLFGCLIGFIATLGKRSRFKIYNRS